LANIIAGKQQYLYLGNLDSKRDWGYAPDHIAAMWKMMQCDEPHDLVIGTGESHSVREFLTESFSYVNMDWEKYVKIDPRYFRPNEVNFLQADWQKAKKLLDWEPRVFFKDLVKIMVDADLELAGLESPGEGSEILKRTHGEWHRWGQQVVSMDK
jgi:GDPmannose 4,6-dehydratase